MPRPSARTKLFLHQTKYFFPDKMFLNSFCPKLKMYIFACETDGKCSFCPGQFWFCPGQKIILSGQKDEAWFSKWVVSGISYGWWNWSCNCWRKGNGNITQHKHRECEWPSIGATRGIYHLLFKKSQSAFSIVLTWQICSLWTH